MANLGKKIGFLRNFIKSKLPKLKIGNKNGKHGKELKIIESFNVENLFKN